MSSRVARAFTLTELLVTIGIIGLLIAILLPTLAKVRRSSQRTVCQSNLRQLAQAAITFAQEHDGYLPMHQRNLGPVVRRSSPPAVVGGIQWGFTEPRSSWDYVLSSQMKSTDVFRCPSDAFESVRSPAPDYPIPDSYRWNASNDCTGRLHTSIAASDSWRAPNLSALRPASSIILVVDGATGETPAGFHLATWESSGGNAVSYLNSANVGQRHSGQANYAFADGHVDAQPFDEAWTVLGGTAPRKTTSWRVLYPAHAPGQWGANHDYQPIP